MDIVFATANINKLNEAKTILGPLFNITTPQQLGYNDDIAETSNTIKENAIQKAQFIWDKFHLDCFADDTGLEIDALNGAPGVYSARYSGEDKNPRRNVQRVLQELSDVPDSERGAHFKCVIALIIGGQLHTFTGICRGYITRQCHGLEGFGYDPIFLPTGSSKTMAQMSMEEKNAISHRGEALNLLKEFLDLH